MVDFFFLISPHGPHYVVYRLEYKRFTEAEYCTFNEKRVAACGLRALQAIFQRRISYCIPLDLRCSIFRSKTFQDPIFFTNTPLMLYFSLSIANWWNHLLIDNDQIEFNVLKTLEKCSVGDCVRFSIKYRPWTFLTPKLMNKYHEKVPSER